jgi:hypothetical protein
MALHAHTLRAGDGPGIWPAHARTSCRHLPLPPTPPPRTWKLDDDVQLLPPIKADIPVKHRHKRPAGHVHKVQALVSSKAEPVQLVGGGWRGAARRPAVHRAASCSRHSRSTLLWEAAPRAPPPPPPSPAAHGQAADQRLLPRSPDPYLILTNPHRTLAPRSTRSSRCSTRTTPRTRSLPILT